MPFGKNKPTNYYTPEETLSNDYVEFATGIARRVINYDANGNLIGGLNLPIYDYVSRTLSASDTVTWTFKSGGSSGSTVATVVIVYTDSTLNTILNVTKT